MPESVRKTISFRKRIAMIGSIPVMRSPQTGKCQHLGPLNDVDFESDPIWFTMQAEYTKTRTKRNS